MADSALRFDAVLPQGAQSELQRLDAKAAWHAVEEAVGTAEELGCRGVWAVDRFESLPRRAPVPLFDGWTTLTMAATLSERLRLGLITPPAPDRDVLQTAKRAAVLDVVSGGRLTVALDAVRQPPSAVAETAEVLRRLWADGTAEYEGEHLSLRRSYCQPTPLSRLPLLILDGEDAPGADGVIRRGGPAGGTDGGPDGGADSGPDAGGRAVLLDCRLFEDRRERDRWLASPHVIMFWSEHPDVYVPRNLIGTVEAVAERLQAYVDAGTTEFILYFRDYPALTSLRTFMTEVVPALGAAAVS
jgi:alkanesulfonate monooxygenase SsuD/methylene tetrahydromethanopterin reductase-like flavin-dependent oxidoreductase (luciferase family)